MGNGQRCTLKGLDRTETTVAYGWLTARQIAKIGDLHLLGAAALLACFGYDRQEGQRAYTPRVPAWVAKGALQLSEKEWGKCLRELEAREVIRFDDKGGRWELLDFVKVTDASLKGKKDPVTGKGMLWHSWFTMPSLAAAGATGTNRSGARNAGAYVLVSLYASEQTGASIASRRVYGQKVGAMVETFAPNYSEKEYEAWKTTWKRATTALTEGGAITVEPRTTVEVDKYGRESRRNDTSTITPHVIVDEADAVERGFGWCVTRDFETMLAAFEVRACVCGGTASVGDRATSVDKSDTSVGCMSACGAPLHNASQRTIRTLTTEHKDNSPAILAGPETSSISSLEEDLDQEHEHDVAQAGHERMTTSALAEEQIQIQDKTGSDAGSLAAHETGQPPPAASCESEYGSLVIHDDGAWTKWWEQPDSCPHDIGYTFCRDCDEASGVPDYPDDPEGGDLLVAAYLSRSNVVLPSSVTYTPPSP